jgi:hypothetical protein
MSLYSGSYLKREGRPRDDDVLVARLVDRPLRPMLEKGWCNETQVGCSSKRCPGYSEFRLALIVVWPAGAGGGR